MTTATSYSSPKRCLNLYGGLLRRGRGLLFLVFVLEFIFSTVQYWIYLSNTVMKEGAGQGIYFFAGQSQLHTGVMAVCFTGILLVAPLVVGLIQMSYMHSRKAVDVYHSLPVTRPQLLLTNLAAAFTIVMAPTAVNYLLMGVTAAITSGRGAVFDPLGILAEFAGWAVYVLAVLAVVAFVAVLVGTIFDNLIFSMELLAAPAFTVFTVLCVFSLMLAGFTMNNVNYYVVASISPISLWVVRMAMPWSLAAAGERVSDDFAQAVSITNLGVVIWLVLAAVLIAAACLLYRRRPTETAEQSTSRGPLALVGKALFMLLCGPIGSTLLCTILNLTSPLAYLTWTVVLAAVAYVVAEAVLLRGFRGFQRGLVSGGVLLVIAVAFGAVILTGGFGYQDRVPALEEVESVSIDYRGRYHLPMADASTKTPNQMSEEERQAAIADGTYYPYYYDLVNTVTLIQPESIQAVEEIHQMILRQQGGGRDTWDVNSSTGSERYGYVGLQITYHLQGGGVLRRQYSGIPGDAIEALARLENLEEFKTETHPIFTAQAADFSSVTIQGITGEAAITDSTQIARLIDALAADYREETVDSLMDGSQEDLALVAFQYAKEPDQGDLTQDTYLACRLIVTREWTRTTKLLQELGLESLLAGDTGNVARAVVVSDGRYYYNGPVQIPDQGAATGELLDEWLYNHYGYSTGNGDYYDTEDPQMIARLAREGTIQYMGHRFMAQLVLADEDNQILSVWSVPYDQLPREVYNTLPPYEREEYEASRGLQVGDSGSPAETAVLAAAVPESSFPAPVSSPEDAIQVTQ